MSWTTCLSGLPEDPAAWTSILVAQYLLLLSVLDLASGGTASQMAGYARNFYLPRCGYRRWCRRVLRRAWASASGLLCLVFLLSLLLSGDPVKMVAIAWAVLALNILTLSGVQTLLILLFGASAGYAPLIFVQLLSLFLSNNMTGGWKLLLPGNWGMVRRSTLAQAGGYSLAAAVGIEITLLLLIYTEGWRLLRWYDRKGVRG